MAKRFKFKLDPLLRQREHAEEQRKRALAEVNARLTEQTERAKRYERLVRDEHQDLRAGHLVGELEVTRLAHHRRYVNSLLTATMHTLIERAQTQQQTSKARGELAEAVRQRKVIEKLRDRRRREWQQHVDKVETDELDEMGVQLHRRSRVAGG